jgi:hypothetical protein
MRLRIFAAMVSLALLPGSLGAADGPTGRAAPAEPTSATGGAAPDLATGGTGAMFPDLAGPGPFKSYDAYILDHCDNCHWAYGPLPPGVAKRAKRPPGL